MSVPKESSEFELKIDHDNPVPLHVQAEQLLRRMIELPEYQKGNYLPKETDLARKLGINRNTLRSALSKLVYEGLLIRKKGVGTKVAENIVTTRLSNWHSFTHEMNQKGITLIDYNLECQWVKSGSEISEFFEISEETEILMLARLRGDEDGAFVYFESYFHPRIGLTGEEDFTKPLYDILENEYSIVPSISKEYINASSSSAITASRLNINTGDPLLTRKRLVSDPGNRPIEYNIGYYRADKFTYSIEIQR